MLAWILDKPNDWSFNSRSMARKGKEGRDAIRTSLKELETNGYVRYGKRQDDRGRWVTEAVVYESPVDSEPSQDGGFSGPGGLADFQAPDRGLGNRSPEIPALKADDSHKELNSPLTPASGGGRRKNGSNPRSLGTNPRGKAPDPQPPRFEPLPPRPRTAQSKVADIRSGKLR